MSPADDRSTPKRLPAVVMAVLASAHLIGVSLFIWARHSEASTRSLHHLLRTYKNLVGLSRDYRFFAPSVASDLRAGFILTLPGGESAFQAFPEGGREVGLRFHSLVAAGMFDQDARDLLARSWAGVVLSQHPEASRVTVVAQSYDLPTMAEFTAGRRPKWRAIYATGFDRQEKTP